VKPYSRDYTCLLLAGKITYSSGAIYDGEFDANKMHGQGRYVFPLEQESSSSSSSSSSSNTGSSNTTANGTATKRRATYVGRWVNNKMHGTGKYTNSEGVEWAGTFSNGSYCNGQSRVVLRP
jgi:hypothetical protein